MFLVIWSEEQMYVNPERIVFEFCRSNREWVDPLVQFIVPVYSSSFNGLHFSLNQNEKKKTTKKNIWIQTLSILQLKCCFHPSSIVLHLIELTIIFLDLDLDSTSLIPWEDSLRKLRLPAAYRAKKVLS